MVIEHLVFLVFHYSLLRNANYSQNLFTGTELHSEYLQKKKNYLEMYIDNSNVYNEHIKTSTVKPTRH